ncbi:MAG: glycoside hydrolase family 3 C-terminal domain-containing protein [Solobacterium sp.]|jgi:beta-glucosidase|nr:glycoside hydrolase family 3 C-terminal domain-containing protein [Solobacterium sp.]MCH4222499.1 glycoside hydrolase family 3 C-terminal domain-containing protein [Solobacterium sp.]MCH4265454.1 glycoside hydrolase family 3 C-terminal domain-containing protein [Solobacterium sp.]
MDQDQIRHLEQQLTLEEKASLCSGAEMFSTQAIERLGIPSFRLSDGPNGLRLQLGKQDFSGRNKSVQAICYPPSCTVGSSFHPELVEEMGKDLGRICQANDVQVLLGPGICQKRSPLCGRNFEYFSEDPLVSGVLGSAYVKGVQSEGVGVSLKHFLANSQESRRRTENSVLDERTLREIYASAFERVVKESHPWTVMAAYNQVNGIYATESPAILKDLLRSEWGFDELVVSDWMAVHDRVASIRGGCDLTMPCDKNHDHLLVEAVQNGTLDEKELDECCCAIIALAFKAQENRHPDTVYDYEAGHALARRIAEEGMVLLKNSEHILPLDPNRRIAVIGKFAEEPRYQGAGSSKVEPYHVPTMPEVTAAYPNITYAEGFGFGGTADQAKLEEAVNAASAAEIAVVIAGLPPVMESEGYDRWIMKLPECQNELIEQVCKVQKNTIVILENGSPVDMPWIDQPMAVLKAYLGGEAACEAIFDLLQGKVNPSGHLAESFPVKVEDNPSYLYWPSEDDLVEYREGVFTGYRYYTSAHQKTLFPFGYGLSYSEFRYSDLKLSSDQFKAGETMTAQVSVTNVSKIPGYVLVQLYVGTDISRTGIRRPVRELRGFKKIYLNAGETETVSFELSKRSFAVWDLSAHTWRVPGGHYELQIGLNAEEIVLSAGLAVQDEYIPVPHHYSIMTPIMDIVKIPAGKQLVDRLMPSFRAVIAKLSTAAASAETDIPYGDLRPDTVGLMAEPLQTLQRFAQGMTEEDWEKFFQEINHQEKGEY